MSTTAHLQPEFEYRVDERDWAAVRLLVEELEQELAERRNHLLYRITTWCFAMRVFKRVECEKVVMRAPTERDSKYHRAILAFLRGCGEVLLVELGAQQDVDPEKVGLSYADLAAMIEDLRISERATYGDMTESRRSQILTDVFGEAATTA